MTYKVYVSRRLTDEIGAVWDMRTWAQQTCKGYISDELTDDGYWDGIMVTKFVFDNEAEATLFKLRWP